jgi:hypothetical protein
MVKSLAACCGKVFEAGLGLIPIITKNFLKKFYQNSPNNLFAFTQVLKIFCSGFGLRFIVICALETTHPTSLVTLGASF